uniref:ADAM metallopeptidase with thrombospondin type 1 motif, 12 n=1 Tax=Nothobranchius kuhntae TaxID=321403 RepID=A0A1A8I798_NOTKU
MVVADSKLIEYHGGDNVESYVFTIMNMVAGIFHDASIGNAIHVVLVRLILLQGEEKGLKIAHHADTTLSSFCTWQKNLNPQNGTRCGPDKWCISGECVIVGQLRETVSGGWGPWSKWSHCSRTCGTGVQSADRECNNPKPEFGGKYCTGERKRYRTCNTKPCQNDKPTFREMLCSEFDTVPYHNELYHWIPVANPVSPCELHCRPVGEHFAEKMLDTVTDGTPCFMNNKSRNICVNGVCKVVWLGVEDRCGVCLGDGTSCETVYKRFDGEDGFGYVDVGVIPAGARDVLVKEMEEAGNFLAVKSVGSDEYFLNGNYIIQWNGEYEAGGTTFYYERSGNMENLTAPGPTKHPVMLQLLFQEKNPGIKYEYTIRKSKKTGNEVAEPMYRWTPGAWTDCSTTCGLGVQHQPIRCSEVDVGVVDESLCDPDSRPEDRHRKCKNMECPARWWVGGWQQCTATCGSEGLKKRTVLCVRTVSGEERVLHPVECRHLLKPKPVVPCNRDVPCGRAWAVGSWEECPVTCGGAVRSRRVSCSLEPQKACNLSTKPRSRSLCALQSCPKSGSPGRSGLPPTYRRINPPKIRPTKQSDSPLWTPKRTTAAPTTSTKETTTVFTATTTSFSLPEIIDPEDDEFSVVRKNGPTESTFSKTNEKSTVVKEENSEEREETEEGSTPNTMPYTPGYDYVVEGRTTEEEKIIDLDVVTTVTSRTSQTMTPTAETSPFTMHLTRPTYSNISTHVYWTQQVPPPTPVYGNRSAPKKQAPASAVRKLSTTASPQPNVTGSKLKTSPVTVEKNNPVSRVKQSKATQSKSQQPRTGSTNQRNLTARAPVSTDVFWLVGNWSECSTTCGIGAVWRSVMCSSQNEEDCANMKRPEPARTCHLQPCATWQTSSWSKCPDECGSCSGSCGEGIRERLVYCPEPHRCSTTLTPNSTERCRLEPCSHWAAGDWEECSVSCGEGQQQRAVKCVSEQDSVLMPNSLCEKVSKPETLRKCNMQECKKKSVCRKNATSSLFCNKLKLLGRCLLRSVQKQCCFTCGS